MVRRAGRACEAVHAESGEYVHAANKNGAMRQGSNPRRPRSRGNGRRHSGGRGNNVESNGPEVKIRGTAQQVLDKYLALAQDAYSAGDRVAAEAYFQYADHYYRVINGDGGGGQNNGQDRDNQPKNLQPENKPVVEGEADAEGEVIAEAEVVSKATASVETDSASEAQAPNPETEPISV